jgi:hypothetical protein
MTVRIEDRGNKSFYYRVERDGLVTEMLYPAVYCVSVKNGNASVLSVLPDTFSHLNTDIPLGDLYVNGSRCQTEADAIAANEFIGSFKSGGSDGVSPEDLQDFVREVPPPETTSAIVKINSHVYNGLGIASNGKTYFLNNGSGIFVLNESTGTLDNAGITSGHHYNIGRGSSGKTYFFGYGLKVLNDNDGTISFIEEFFNSHSLVVASNGKTYVCGRGKGIRLLDESTGTLSTTNITSGNYYYGIVASNGKTYFVGLGGIKVLNDSTGNIDNTNITSGDYYCCGIASNGRTYFGGTGIKVLNDSTGSIESTNIASGDFGSFCIASNGRTYFGGLGSIKVLNDSTGNIDATNIASGNYYGLIGINGFGIASDGRTYFCSTAGVKVLDDATGLIGNSNITSGSFNTLGIASNGKTYFIGSAGTHVLEITPVDEAWVRKFGEWLPVEDVMSGGSGGVSTEDASDTVTQGAAKLAVRTANKVFYIINDANYFSVKIDDSFGISVSGGNVICDGKSGSFSGNGYTFSMGTIEVPDFGMIAAVNMLELSVGGTTGSYMTDAYNNIVLFVNTGLGNVFKVTLSNGIYLEIEKLA